MDKKKIILYRSRFQPSFSEPHIEAVEKLIELLKNKGENIQNCLFGFSVVKHDFEDKNITIKELTKQGFDEEDWKRYLSRFSNEFNKTSIGEIKTKIAFEIEIDKRTATFIMPNLVRTSIAMIRKDNNNDKEILDSLPPLKENEIHWYFPIYDMDDINDMGFLSSVFYKMNSNNLETTKSTIDNRILFSRYNYEKNVNKTFKYRRKYFGRYTKILNISEQNEIKRNHTQYYSLEIPNISKIPYIYKWSSIFYISEKLIELFNFLDSKSKKNITEIYIKKLEDIKQGLIDNKQLFSGDLIAFFEVIKQIHKNINKNSEKFEKDDVEFFNGIYDMIINKYFDCEKIDLDLSCPQSCEAKESCEDFWEDHFDENLRVNDILKKIDNLINT